MTVHPVVAEVTARIADRSAATRADYLLRVRKAAAQGPSRAHLGCANLAHGIAGCSGPGREVLADVAAPRGARPDVAIVTAYNDMLSAHVPLATYPDVLKEAVLEAGGVAQVAGGVPAMCDGITQGHDGMELSLFSRDVIALATVVALSHDMFDAALMLGVCDKIVPGLLIGALSFGHLPTVFVPAGPMTSGLSNKDKAAARQAFATGAIDRQALLAAELGAYHSEGTCTFYGTANSNQMLMEIMGLHVPGTAFVHPHTPLRTALTAEAGRTAVALAARGDAGIGEILDARALVNGMVGLLATGGSTNHALHLPAVARAAGLLVELEDLAELSTVVPLLARVYPNGAADVNQFHAAGGLAFVVHELLRAGLVHGDVRTVAGDGLVAYTHEPHLRDGALVWTPGTTDSLDRDIVRPIDDPFDRHGGLQLLTGNLGRAIAKVSAVAPAHRHVRAPARVFDDQRQVLAAFASGELAGDAVVVVRFQGPRANGMPELHKLTPVLGVLQDRGHAVALVTDGRMSGASGKVLSAVHVAPEALPDGPLARVRDGDVIEVDGVTGRLTVEVTDAELAARTPATPPRTEPTFGLGRELFAGFRERAGRADHGASAILPTGPGWT
ncbi:MAG: phosphogluconate dehydratase [Alphaproteobacteria bacterium]|nr:phosphogluconate dehydratase [Alphaproteobacteria bacterium]